LLKRELPADGKAARYASRICDGAAEADQIISSMMSLAARERLSLELVEPRPLVEDAVASAMRVAPSGRASEWKVECVVDAPSFRCDRIKLRQALRNLVANSIQAQPNGGWVRVDCRVEGGEVALRVADGGPGIPRELARRVAEPFFTTRAEGTGLGLALVHAIADLHGGRFEVSPTKAHAGGAEVSIHIPLHIA
jgi:signal transduction histidine kinase